MDCGYGKIEDLPAAHLTSTMYTLIIIIIVTFITTISHISIKGPVCRI